MSPAKCSVARRIGLRVRVLRIAMLLPAVGLAACSGESFGPLTGFSNCSLPLTNFTDAGVERSSIPALTNPEVATRLIAPHVGYVNRSDLVIGLEFNGQPLAIPLKLLWYHEVLNLQADVDSTVAGAAGERLTVTYSPLTGSVSVFDPEPSGTPDFAVSSYVLDNNLVMDDGSGTLYPQLTRSATCGPQDGISLERVPYELMVYGAWLQVFQDTWIATRVTGHDFLYTLYPYGNYRDPDNASLFYPTSAPIDLRRRPKERGSTMPVSTGGLSRSKSSTVAGRTWKRGACGTSAARPWRARSTEKGSILIPGRTTHSGSPGRRSSRTRRCGSLRFLSPAPRTSFRRTTRRCCRRIRI